MADLGSIEFRGDSVSEAAAVDQRNRDIVEGIAGVAEIAVEAAQEDVLGTFREQLNTTTDQVQAQTPKAPEPTGDPAFDRLQTLKFAVQQGDSKQQDRAALEGRKLLQEAINRNPRMRTQLAQEFRLFTTGDPEFAALGLQDVATKSSSALALAEIEDIKAEAYGDGVGQLGMDPLQFEFGSQEFIQQYQYRKGIEQQRAENSLLISAMESQRNLDVKMELPKWQSAMTGKREFVTNLIQEADVAAREVAKAFRNPNTPQNQAIITAWNQVGRDEHFAQISDAIGQLEMSVAAIDLKWADTPEYQAVVNLKDSTVAELQKLAEGVITDSPTLMNVHEAMQTARRMEFEAANPDVIELGMWADEMEPIIDQITLLDGGEALIKNELGLVVRPSVQRLIGRIRGLTGQGQLKTGVTPIEDAEQLDQVRRQNPAHEAYDHGIPTTRANQTAAFQDSVMAADLRRQMVDSQLDISPAFARDDLGAQYQRMKYTTEAGPVPDDVAGEILEMLGDESMVPIIKQARLSDTPARPVIFGDGAEEFFAKTNDPQRRRERYTALRDETIFGVSMSEVIKPDLGQLDEGKVVFRVDEDLIRVLLPEPGTLAEAELRFEGIPSGARPGFLKRAREIARDLSNIVSREVRAKAHIEFAQNDLDAPDYLAQWEIGIEPLSALFGAVEGEDGERQSP